MSSRIMNWPNKVNSRPVSNTTRPVTHTALVAVNKASTKEMPAGVANGSNSSMVPMQTNRKKLKTKASAGCRVCLSMA